VSFVSQWNALERELPEKWSELRLAVAIDDAGDCDRAVALLGFANPLRRGNTIRLFASRRAGAGPEAVHRLLARLDRERIRGRLELVGADEPEARQEQPRASLAEAWDAAVAQLPPDWSDVFAQLALTSTDLLDRTALLVSPLNPDRPGREPVLRFRVARRFGYGVAPTMARRALERLDEEGIPGALRILRVLSDTHNVATQGPVWRVGGRAV